MSPLKTPSPSLNFTIVSFISTNNNFTHLYTPPPPISISLPPRQSCQPLTHFHFTNPTNHYSISTHFHLNNGTNLYSNLTSITTPISTQLSPKQSCQSLLHFHFNNLADLYSLAPQQSRQSLLICTWATSPIYTPLPTPQPRLISPPLSIW